MKTSLEIIAFLILIVPVIWEVYDDRKSDPDKVKDVFIRAGLMIACGFIAAVLRKSIARPFDEIFMSFALFFLTFDYAMAVVLKKPIHFLGTTSKMDKFGLWVKLGSWGRFVVKMAVFIAALTIYF